MDLARPGEDTLYRRGQSFDAWLDLRMEVRTSPIHGSGMFARHTILPGEIVICWGGTIFDEEDLRSRRIKPRSAAMVSQGLYIGDPANSQDEEEFFLNHSCDPNLWMAGALSLAARRTIKAGEELIADYALWECDGAWVLDPCHCGSALCRGRVSGSDWQLTELQQRYEGHFTHFLNKKIAAIKSPHGNSGTNPG